MRQPKRFVIPPKGVYQCDIDSDPLRFYYNPLVGWLFRMRTEMVLSHLKPTYKNILEIGYGSGILLPSLNKMGNNLFGIDIASNPDLVNKNLETVGVKATLVQEDAQEMTFDSEYFDLVVSVSMMIVFKDPRKILEETHRVLKPNGYLLIGIPREDWLIDWSFKILGFHDFDDFAQCNQKIIRQKAQDLFELEEMKRLPSSLPSFCNLYCSMLFRKK